MKVIAIGRNYVDHIEELKNEVPSEPVVFMKPDSAVLKDNAPFYYPSFSKDVHYEVEIVIKISKMGKNIEEKFAHKYYDEIGIGIDFTARDIQAALKTKGLPWERAKAFNDSAPISAFLPKTQFKLDNLNFSLQKNGKMVQNGNTSKMIYNFDSIISYVSRYFTLKTGDLIFTGTPAGVGPVQIGDQLTAFIEDKNLLDFSIK